VRATPGPTRRSRPTLRSLETELFRVLNRLVEPRLRAGCAAPRLAPGGLVLVEIRGRTTGRTIRVPLAATRIQGHVVVSTFRGRRSQWVRNLLASPEVRVWSDGRARRFRAVVLAPGHRPPRTAGLPPVLRWVLSFLAPYTYAGWAFAVLAPESEATLRPIRARTTRRPQSSKARRRARAASSTASRARSMRAVIPKKPWNMPS
jgi:deazaflavin-dependent oxidoreductase (nitroreductase family)